MTPVVGLAGMTHLGLVTAAALADKGFLVVGFDADEGLIDRLSRLELPVVEPGLPDLVETNGDRLTFTADPGALKDCDVIYVAPDVDTDDAGQSDLTALRALIDVVLGQTGLETPIIILSQVPPGFTRGFADTDPRFFCQVETLIFGRAVERALRPERIIVGSADPAAPLPASFATVLHAFECPILRMGFESAELAKIAINLCLVASVSTANTLAELCEKLGADWSEISPALKLDRRIGEHAYLSPGLGLAGGNLERDLATVVRLADTHGTDAGLVTAEIANSRRRRKWAFETLERMVLADKADAGIAVLGLAYKENTLSTKNSPALELLKDLGDHKTTVYDPVVPSRAAGTRVTGADSALAAAEGADALVIMTPWPEFRDIAPSDLADRMSGKVIIDPYRVFDPEAVRAAGFKYATLGMAADA